MSEPGSVSINARRRASRTGRSRQAALGEASGFSILELVIVVVVIGVLSAAALTRFIDRIGDAHNAAVTGTSSAFRSGVSLVHMKWLGEGSPGAVLDFLPITSDSGHGALSVNANGWPANMQGSNSTLNSATGCEDVWIAVLNAGAPSISKAMGSAAYQAIYSGSNRCEYQFQAEPQLSFGFDSNTGRVRFDP